MDTMILMYERLSAADSKGLFKEPFFFPASPVTSNGLLMEVVLAWSGEIKDRAEPTAMCRRKCFGCGMIAALVVEQLETQITTTKKKRQNNDMMIWVQVVFFLLSFFLR